MRITSLVENTALPGFKGKHGLSFHIETETHRILFDLGPDGTLFRNAAKAGIDLLAVDTVVISHGHRDHGGALGRFLEANSKAKVYVQRTGFARHTTRLFGLHADVGLDPAYRNHPQVVLVDGDYAIDQELSLFTVSGNGRCASSANNLLCEEGSRDVFAHEQNLVVREKSSVVFVGCGHCGIVNIMEKAIGFQPEACIGGYHLYNPLNRRTERRGLLADIAAELRKYPRVKFFACHCTGRKASRFLKSRLPNLWNLPCGASIVFGPSSREST